MPVEATRTTPQMVMMMALPTNAENAGFSARSIVPAARVPGRVPCGAGLAMGTILPLGLGGSRVGTAVGLVDTSGVVFQAACAGQ